MLRFLHFSSFSSTGTLPPKPAFQIGQALLEFKFKIDLIALSTEDVDDVELKKRLEVRDQAVQELKKSFKKDSDAVRPNRGHRKCHYVFSLLNPRILNSHFYCLFVGIIPFHLPIWYNSFTKES